MMNNDSTRRGAPEKPQTLRQALDLIPPTFGDTGIAYDVPVARMHGQVFSDELAAAETHYGRLLMAVRRELLDPVQSDRDK
jgi:hypothetical protein